MSSFIYIKGLKKNIYINPTICSSKLLSLQIVDGAWSRWGSWGACSTTCGTGVHIRYRSCDSPKPAYGGHNCRGANHQSQKCNLGPCPSTSFIICCFDNIASTIKNPSFFKFYAQVLTSLLQYTVVGQIGEVGALVALRVELEVYHEHDLAHTQRHLTVESRVPEVFEIHNRVF